MPENTRRNTQWGFNTYQSWAQFRNTQEATLLDLHGPVPIDLAAVDHVKMDYWLTHFVYEVRKSSGERYPPRSLYNLAASLQRYYKEDRNRPDMCFLDDRDYTFKQFRDVLDAVMKDSHAKGESTTRQTDPVTEEDERQLWESGVVGTVTSKPLINAVFLYNGKIFGIRGGEHRQVLREQYRIVEGPDGEYIEFTERKAKNRQGGLRQRKVQPRIVQHYAIPGSKTCVVDIFKRYFALIPSTGPLYRRPLIKPNCCKFSIQPIGPGKLNSFLRTMFCDAKINMEGRVITNHSLRVALVTNMQDTGYDNFDIQSRSGHRSQAIDAYKRQSVKRKQEISRQLDLPHTISCADDVKPRADDVECTDPTADSTPPVSKQIKILPDHSGTTQTADCADDDNTLIVHVPKSVGKVVLRGGTKETVVLF